MGEHLIQLILGLCIGAVAYFLRDYKDRQEKSNEGLQGQIDTIKDDLSAYKLKAADKYVLKDDFVRATSITDRKLDKIYDEIIKLSKAKTEG